MLSKKMQKWVKEAKHLHGQKARKGICSHIFLWNVSLAFHELIGPNLMHFPISIIFPIISKFQFFDIDNFADNLTNADLSAFDNFFRYIADPYQDVEDSSSSLSSLLPKFPSIIVMKILSSNRHHKNMINERFVMLISHGKRQRGIGRWSISETRGLASSFSARHSHLSPPSHSFSFQIHTQSFS